MSETSPLDDQIRGIAMALRHWFEVTETEALMREAAIRPNKSRGFFSRSVRHRRFAVFALTALPPQVVRLKSDSPVTTLHLLQDVYDDGELRADPWRWWFAWISVEMIARLGPDATGGRVKEFILRDDSLQHLRTTAARWLASNPVRVDILEREFASLVDTIRSRAEADGRPQEESLHAVLRHPVLTIIEAMAGEAGRISSAVTTQLAERIK